jgi:hypothetical protein
MDERRNSLKNSLLPYNDVVTKVRKAYLDRPSAALAGKHEIEFEIKRLVSDRYSVPFRSVVFTGSAQLGFSPHKDTEFELGKSDLDVACIDIHLYQKVWEVILSVTKGFNDLSKFQNTKHASLLQNHMLKRGMILLDYMPNCQERTKEREFLDSLSRPYRRMFTRVSLAIYMNEWAFCWKQESALANILGYDHAE